MIRKLCATHAPLVHATVAPCDCEFCRKERECEVLTWKVEALKKEVESWRKEHENEPAVRL